LISNNNIYYKTSSCVIDGIPLPNIIPFDISNPEGGRQYVL